MLHGKKAGSSNCHGTAMFHIKPESQSQQTGLGACSIRHHFRSACRSRYGIRIGDTEHSSAAIDHHRLYRGIANLCEWFPRLHGFTSRGEKRRIG